MRWVDKEKKREINYLLGIIGVNFSEIEPPEGGWTSDEKNIPFQGESSGKFFIKEDGIIDYLHKNFALINWQQYSPSLINLAIDQLRVRCRKHLSYKTRNRKFPNIHFLLLKYHDIQ